MQNAFAFLIEAVFGLYIGVVLLRLFLQWVRADFYNPVSQFVVKLTNPLLVPLRRLIPGYGGIDLAALVLAYALAVLSTAIVYALPPIDILLKALFVLMSTTFSLFFWMVVIRALMSWISPGHHPAARVLDQLTEPVLRPIRRVVPPLGGLDLSPLIFLLLLGFVSRLLGISGGLF
jgi:YggT family protein